MGGVCQFIGRDPINFIIFLFLLKISSKIKLTELHKSKLDLQSESPHEFTITPLSYFTNLGCKIYDIVTSGHRCDTKPTGESKPRRLRSWWFPTRY